MKSLGNGKLSPGFDHECLATREILSLVGDKWSVLLIVCLSHGAKRFSELKRTVEGISQRMLTHTLRALERDGLVTRTVFPTKPPSVEYALTKLGRTLLRPVLHLALWAQSHRGEVFASRAVFERAAARARG